MSSGFEPIEAIEVTVFRRSRGVGTWLGDGTASLVPEVLLDSQEKLMPNFLGGGAVKGVETVGFEAGGGPQGIDGRFPDRPCDRIGSFGGEVAMLFSVVAVAVESDRIELVSFVPSSCTLLREEAEIRCAVSKGDLVGVSSLSGIRASCLCTDVSSEDCTLDPRGVEGDEGGRRLVREREDADDRWDWGRSELSCASSKLSPSLSELSALEGMGPLSAIVVTCLGYSQGNAIQGGIDRLCNWASLLGRACTRKGKL